MNAVSAIARTGLSAATRRLEASASNIANARSGGALPGADGPTVYTPRDVHLSAQAGGGVEASLVPSARDALLAYDPQAPFANAQGYVAMPAVELTQDMLNLAMASYDFAANLAVIRTADEMSRAVLEIRA